MRLTDIGWLVAYAIFLSFGQVLFKMSSRNLGGASNSTTDVLFRLGASPVFWLAIAVYGALTLLWIWILSRVSLVAAYPFVALCFIFVPMLSRYYFNEQVGVHYMIGVVLVMAGLGFIVSEVGK